MLFRVLLVAFLLLELLLPLLVSGPGFFKAVEVLPRFFFVEFKYFFLHPTLGGNKDVPSTVWRVWEACLVCLAIESVPDWVLNMVCSLNEHKTNMMEAMNGRQFHPTTPGVCRILCNVLSFQHFLFCTDHLEMMFSLLFSRFL